MNLFYLTCERTSFQSGGGDLLQDTSHMHCIIKNKNKRILSYAWCMHLTFPERTAPQDTHAQLLLPQPPHTQHLCYTHTCIPHLEISHWCSLSFSFLMVDCDQHLAMCLDIFQNPCQNKCIRLGRIPKYQVKLRCITRSR